MKYTLLKLEKFVEWLASFMFFPLLFIIYIQADNNKQLIYDLNVSQTALMIQKDEYKKLEYQIAEGLCLPRLEMR